MQLARCKEALRPAGKYKARSRVWLEPTAGEGPKEYEVLLTQCLCHLPPLPKPCPHL